MTGYFFHIACLVLAGSVATRAADSSGILTETDVADLLGIHNTKRGLTALGQTQGQPAATNMVKLQWDNDLAASSKAHADKCVSGHSSGSGNGENLAAGASSSDDIYNIASLINGVESWYDEHTDYDFVSNSCNQGEVCGHYTQVVWATTTKVGCGFSACTGLFPTTFPYQYMMVCQYSPPGNYNGKKPYEAAATTGEIASACPTGTSPNLAEGLCVAPTMAPVAAPVSAPVAAPVIAPSASTCENAYDECESWADNGYCLSSSQYSEWMQINCEQSCNMCSPVAAPVSAPVVAPVSAPVAAPVSAPSASTCENAYDECEYWADNGHCLSSSQYSEWMEINCGQSCNMC